MILDFYKRLKCLAVSISDMIIFLSDESVSYFLQIKISVIDFIFQFAITFEIQFWDCLIDEFNQFLNDKLFTFVDFQLVFIYDESCQVEFLICSYKLHKFDKFLLRILLNSWLRIFCSCSLIISLWLKAYLKCCHKTRIDVNIWFSWFLNRNFQFLNYISEICNYCC